MRSSPGLDQLPTVESLLVITLHPVGLRLGGAFPLLCLMLLIYKGWSQINQPWIKGKVLLLLLTLLPSEKEKMQTREY